MQNYSTSEVGRVVGLHPNTVRLYEELGLIPKPSRKENGYRIFTEFHIAQIQFARLALQVEVLQSGLRKKVIEIIRSSAVGEFSQAKILCEQYILQLQEEKRKALEAIEIANGWRKKAKEERTSGKTVYKRKEAAEMLDVTMDALRNWEMNGLLTIKRSMNGYRVYTDEDLNRLRLIRTLRYGNYSLSAILRMLGKLEDNPEIDLLQAINHPDDEEDFVSVCDRLVTSLQMAEHNIMEMRKKIRLLEKIYKENPPL